MNWARTQLTTHGRWLAALLALAAIAGGAGFWAIRRRADREFAGAREALARAAFVPFERELRAPVRRDGVTLLQTRREVRDLARFDEAWFAATGGGLVEWSEDGARRRAYTVLDGLPESDLTALAVFGGKLCIGTRTRGLVLFDGRRFERFRWTDRDAQAVTALAEAGGRLLVGTFAGGLLEFDGERFRELRANGERIAGITRLAAEEERLAVGTFSQGLWIRQADAWTRFTAADGLPSNRVVGLARAASQWLVATDFGVAAMPLNAPGAPRFQSLATVPALSGMVVAGDAVLLSKDDGELFRLLPREAGGGARLTPLAWNASARRSDGPGIRSSCQLKVFESKTGQASSTKPEQALWLLSSEGLRRTRWQDERVPGRLAFEAVGPFGEEADPLASNMISAMAFDDAGRLWVGSFRDGIDVFTREGRRLTHLESDSIREINALVWDAAARRMLAGTAQGLVQFGENFEARTITKSDGLLANSVSQIALLEPAGALALATSRGLSLGQADRWQALTSAQGLPGNSVYAVLSHQGRLYAGTLDGLARIEGGRVVRVFKDSNSRLSQNWVTALCAHGDRLFIGAYGGVFELTASGDVVGFASQIGKPIVNPNAMRCDGDRLLVGTLDGVWAMDLRSGRWTQLRDELPSRTVLSLADDGEHFYFGTTSGIARIDKRDLTFARE